MGQMNKVYCQSCEYFNRRSSVGASLHITLGKGEESYIQNFVTELSKCHIPTANEVVNYSWYAKDAKPDEIVMRYREPICSVKNRNNDCKDFMKREDKLDE